MDLSAAYQLIPNLEPVTVSRRTNQSGGVSNFEIEHAKRLVQANEEAEPSDGVYVRQRLSWWLPALEISSTEVPSTPRPGDMITDGDNVLWTIQDVGNPAINVWWKCRCVQLIIEDLTQRITIKLPTNSTDSYASSLTTQASGTPILCAIQEVLTADANYEGIDAFMRYFHIWTFSELYLPQGSILLEDDGTQYEVVRVSDKKLIDSLMMIEAVLQP